MGDGAEETWEEGQHVQTCVCSREGRAALWEQFVLCCCAAPPSLIHPRCTLPDAPTHLPTASPPSPASAPTQPLSTASNPTPLGMGVCRKDMLDEALLRPGRLEVQVEIGLPDEAGRHQILKVGTFAANMTPNVCNFLICDVGAGGASRD